MCRNSKTNNGPNEDRHWVRRKSSHSQHSARARRERGRKGGQAHAPYTHTRTMLNTGGMRGKQKRERGKRRLEERAAAAAGVLVERDREWALDRACGLVFEGLMASARVPARKMKQSKAAAWCKGEGARAAPKRRSSERGEERPRESEMKATRLQEGFSLQIDRSLCSPRARGECSF